MTQANDYQPTSRRPIAGTFRQTAQAAVRLCVRLNIHPDAISLSSIVAAAVAAGCFWQSGRYLWLLLVGPAFLYVRLWINMLDGMVALASGKASSRGEIVNDLPDRISDVLIFAGVAHSGLCSPFSGYWAAIFAVLTAYVGMMGQAVGARREYGGVMSKPWRMVTLHVGAWLMLIFHWIGRPAHIGRLSILDTTCIIIILGCIQTIWVRLSRIFASLAARKV
jgi:phosphatidylglycerophosphate synthase